MSSMKDKKFLIEKVVKQTTTMNLLPCRTMLMKRTISQTRRDEQIITYRFSNYLRYVLKSEKKNDEKNFDEKMMMKTTNKHGTELIEH